MSFISRHVIRNLGQNVLTDDELRRLAPSIFADDKHESRSERYAYIPTSEVVDGMRANGFQPVFAKQGTSRIEGKEAFTKHLIRFRYQGEGAIARKVGGVYPEVVVVNSHDGTSSYAVNAGLTRLVCLNGMLVADRELANVKIPHKGDVRGAVIEGSFTVLEESTRAVEAAAEWSGLTLAPPEAQALAEAAHIIRFGDGEGNVSTPIRSDQLLRQRRREDGSNDLWTTFNRIQENVIRGGLTAFANDPDSRRPRRVTTREVKGIDADVKINKALWQLGERMAALKGVDMRAAA